MTVNPMSKLIVPSRELVGPTRRWTKMRPHAKQREYYTSEARFVVVPAGRRSGKTEICKRRKVKRMLTYNDVWDDPYFVFGAPTHAQAERLFWGDLLKLIPRDFIASTRGTTAQLVNGVQIIVTGMDKPERVEGIPIYDLSLDEYGNMKPEVWPEHLRPALSDQNGRADFIGVPEGMNHYQELALAAQTDTSGDWAFYSWWSEDILPAGEIAAAKRDLDDLTYRQEYQAEFVTFEGLAYYNFDPKIHASRVLPYDPDLDLFLCFDFNVAPGVVAIAQQCPVTGHYFVIGEVWIPRNSNTILVCSRIAADWGKHRGDVYCYGDATGGAKGSAKVLGSDWDLIAQQLRPIFGSRLKFRVPKSNPYERVRVNAVNSFLLNVANEARLFIDPTKAKHVVDDLAGVRLVEGGSGEIDKTSYPKLTHISDALGYMLFRRKQGKATVESG